MREDCGKAVDPTRPERSRLGRRLTGCLGAVALLAVLVVGAVLYAQGTDETPKPLYLTKTQLIGTWKSTDGGTLELRGDGSFSADGVCGFGASNPQVGSDNGTWTPGVGANLLHSQGRSTGGVDLFGKTVQNELDEGGTPSSPVLWEYVGPPEESSTFCTLHRQ